MTSTIETTKRALFDCLERIKRAAKHRTLTAEFEERLEEHLEELRKANSHALSIVGESLIQERDELQARLHAVDRAYVVLDQANKVAGEEFNQSQTNVRHWREECGKLQARIKTFESGELYQKLQKEARQHLNDCREAEKLSDDLGEHLRDAQKVIGHQEQLIIGQRLAIADLYISGRRVNSAVATLQRLGYTDNGGQLWKPPLGSRPDFELCTNPSHHQHCKCGRG